MRFVNGIYTILLGKPVEKALIVCYNCLVSLRKGILKMKRLLKKSAAIFLAACTVLSCILFSSCSALTKDNSPTVLTLDGHKITEAMYSYWANSHKTQYMYIYEDLQDTAAFWEKEYKDGLTVSEYLDSITLDSIKASLVAKKLFSDYDLSFTKDEKQSIDDYISDLITEYANGDKDFMNNYLKEYGIDLNILRNIYLEEEKPAKVFAHLFSEGGEMELKEEDFNTFYEENYVHFQMIFINNKYRYITDDDGYRITDENGYYKTEELDSETKAEKDALISDIKSRLENGEDFDALYEAHSEMKSYPGGYYYTAAETYDEELYYQLILEAHELEIGEFSVFESESGTCIIKKLALDEGAWKKTENSDFFGDKGEYMTDLAKEIAYRELVESYFDKIKVETKIVEKYSVADIIGGISF